MDRLKRARRPHRAAITRIVNELEQSLLQERPERDDVRAKFEILEETMKILNEIDHNVLEQLLDDGCAEEEQDVEVQQMQEYKKRYVIAKQKVDRFLFAARPNSPSPSEANSVVGQRKHFRLPKIELPKFDGELKDWLGFWAQFKKIHEDPEMDSSDKFQYLIQCMVKGSRAHEVVNGYPQSADNYDKAVEALKCRFGRDTLLVQVYVRELLKLVIANVTRPRERLTITKMYDKVESHLRSLESLGVTSDKCDAMLFPLVESSLPEEILKAWERSPAFGDIVSENGPPKSELLSLMTFLRKESESEERITLARTSFGILQREKEPMRYQGGSREGKLPTAAGLFVAQASGCLFCEKQHDSKDCFKARAMSLEEKREHLRRKRVCYQCLRPGHVMRTCKTFVKCVICAKNHYTLMCPSSFEVRKLSENNTLVKDQTRVQPTHSNLNCTSEVLLQTLIVEVWDAHQNHSRKLRALCDPGSQRSYILERTANMLRLVPSAKITLRHLLFGGTQDVQHHNKYKVQVCGVAGGIPELLEVLGHKQICGPIPRMLGEDWKEELKEHDIRFADVGCGSPEIELLIGSDYYAHILTGRKRTLRNGLTALETCFGWTLSGRQNKECQVLGVANAVTTMLVSNASVTDLWNLETIGIQDPIESKTKEDREQTVREHFRRTVARCRDGRYAVSLPWIKGTPGVQDNRTIAEKRLLHTTAKLELLGKYQDYAELFCSWESEGIIEEVQGRDISDVMVHYLPHRAVFKPGSMTTPIRPVFDASCKTSRAPSLNDCLERGPNLIELIPAILTRFREKSFGIVSDIRKAFQMIEVKQEDRDCLRFLWWEDQTKKAYKVYRHKRVVFGVNCSPYLLAAVLEFHLQGVTKEEKLVADKLLESLYVDNCVTSVDDLEDYEKFKTQATKILADAKMELRQWECNTGDVHEYDSQTESHSKLQPEQESCPNFEKAYFTSVLGLRWDTAADTLSCDLSMVELPEKISKRIVLSNAQKVFDPIGFTCPALLQPKLMLQNIWNIQLGWDDELPPVFERTFRQWHEELPFLDRIRIPRNMTGGIRNRSCWQLHVFCDASQDAYAAVVFLRTEEENQVSVMLVQGKSRVAPLKRATIPRLELLACSIAARLAKAVKSALSLEDTETIFWSDSTTALAWIRRNDVWGTFVGNRVKEICLLTKVTQWRHVPGTDNPADLPSRGCSPKQLWESKWWEGPKWLRLPPERWPTALTEEDEEAIFKERKKSAEVATMVNREIDSAWYENRYSSYHRAVKVMAWMRRFVRKARKEKGEKGPLTDEEILEAEKALLRMIQAEVFPVESSFISGLKVQRDEEGLIRLITRLLFRDDNTGFKKPILLPNRHTLVDLIIREVHEKSGHAGVQYVMSKLREKYWIIQGRKAVRRILNRCVRCLRFTAKSTTVDSSALPPERVNDAHVFQTTGVDLAGPLFLKGGKKAWVVLFTCAVYRCVHLDFVVSLSTEAFLGALTRFIKTRGRPSIIYSDNGTNFTGAQRGFKTLNWDKIRDRFQVDQIRWKFNPPTAAWWGGWWERLIRSVKDLLKRMLGRSRVNQEELRTCLAEVEGVINDRPLTTVTEDPEDLIPLTPAMFLRGIPSDCFPEYQVLGPQGFRQAFRQKKSLQDELRLRFRKEYLGLLVQRSKEKGSPMVKEGDVVLMGSDNKKRLDWTLARIVELIPGKDGSFRVARIRTKHGVLTRPLQRLYPLEVSSRSWNVKIPEEIKKMKGEEVLKLREEFSVTENDLEPEIRTRRGRRVKVPMRYIVNTD